MVTCRSMAPFDPGSRLTRACSRRAEVAPLSARPRGSVSALWNVSLRAGRLEGPQLMRKSLGGHNSLRWSQCLRKRDESHIR
jgi:hypothetical protein